MNKKAAVRSVIVCSAMAASVGTANADVFYSRWTGTTSGGTLSGVNFGESNFAIFTAFDSANVFDVSASTRAATNDWTKVYIEDVGVITLVNPGQTRRINNGVESVFTFFGSQGATMFEARSADFLDVEPASILPETPYTAGQTGPWNIFPQFSDQGALVLNPFQFPITGTFTISDTEFSVPAPASALLLAGGGLVAVRRRRA